MEQKLDSEWIELLKEAIALGVTIQEINLFFQTEIAKKKTD
ncbi:DNA-binding anti-repressor SinI [Alkalihalobacillus pseudalcaliphilus]|nr:DNA-binding anti-repressor SinI [Alkalihalobacillus pseudalcaliphilus]